MRKSVMSISYVIINEAVHFNYVYGFNYVCKITDYGKE